MDKKIRDIHERIYNYVIRVLKLLKQLSKTPENLVIINQLSRAITSTGANDMEADGCLTRKDFIHKYGLVLKEAKESDYWLNIIADTNSNLKPRMHDLIKEGKEIIKIVSTIIYKTKINSNKK